MSKKNCLRVRTVRELIKIGKLRLGKPKTLGKTIIANEQGFSEDEERLSETKYGRGAVIFLNVGIFY